VSVAVLVSSFFIVVFNICITRRLTPDLQLNLKKFKFRTVVEIAKNGVWNSISSLGVTLNSGLDLLITNNMLSSLAMGQLSICKSLITVFNTFVALFTQAFRPIQLEAYAHNDQDRMIHYFKISIKVTGYICIILFAGIVACGKEFLKLWVPSQDIDLIYKVILIIIIGDVVGAISYPLLYIFTIVNKLKIISLITVANGLINVTSMILLLKYTNLGIYAIVITTAVLNIVVQMVVTPLLATSYLKLSWYTFYPLITRCIVCGLLMTVCFAFVSSLISWNLSWIHLIIKAVFLVILGTIICLATLFSKGEISKIILLIKSRRNAVSDI
jgi:O-antigen/teichoic acid export membrane protein